MSNPVEVSANDYPFLNGGGEIGELIRSFNWAATPLGEPGGWPAALKIITATMLASPFPMHIAWGSRLIQLYNDSYCLAIGNDDQSSTLGRPVQQSFPQMRDTVGPLFEKVLSGGSFRFTDLPLPITKNDRTESKYFDLAYSPLINEDGIVCGVLTNATNTTEKLGLQEKAGKERDQLQHFFMQAPAGICILGGLELVFELVNPVYQQLFPGRDLLGKPLLEVLPEVNQQPVWNILQNVLATGKTFDGTELLIPLARTDNGPVEDRYFNFIYQARLDQAGKPNGILVFVIEVTDMVLVRKQAERAEEGLRMAIEAAEMGSFYINTTDRIFHPSPRLKEFFGFNPDEEVPYEAAINQIREDYRQAAADLVENAITTGTRFDMEYPVVGYHDGNIRWVRGLGEVQHFDGKSYFTGVVHDITERKLSNEKSLKLAAIIESSDDAIISKTLESVITSWNNSAERIFGYTEAEMIGETIYKLIPHDRTDEEPQILARLKTGERVDHFETKRVTKDGRLIDVSVTVSPLKDGQGQIIGLSKIARDITEKKLDETRKNDFIGMVSHELKTPLTSLNAIVQVANAKLKNSGDIFLAGAMQKASHQVKRMSAMINGFLNISRLESGELLIEKQPFNLDELINEIIEETQMTNSTHQIHFDRCPAVMVNADRDKISSVISNLVSNAVKYSPAGGIIDISCLAQDKQIIVNIKDNGVGIAAQDAARIFDRYYRVKADHTQHISGFGIGLYLSAEIVRWHGGQIGVHSEPGKGSTFYFSLPL